MANEAMSYSSVHSSIVLNFLEAVSLGNSLKLITEQSDQDLQKNNMALHAILSKFERDLDMLLKEARDKISSTKAEIVLEFKLDTQPIELSKTVNDYNSDLFQTMYEYVQRLTRSKEWVYYYSIYEAYERLEELLNVGKLLMDDTSFVGGSGRRRRRCLCC
ncbi:MAG: hypothetical protein QXO30_01745 [Candidatus Caldarchaeum sp.]